VREPEPGCLLVNPTPARVYACKVVLSHRRHASDYAYVELLTVLDGRVGIAGDWCALGDSGGLAAEVTCWP